MLTTNKINFALLAAAAALVLFVGGAGELNEPHSSPGIIVTRGATFVEGDRVFRFVGANIAVTYGESERESMPETLRLVRESGARVVRVWAHGEWDARSEGRAPNDWLQSGAFRRGRDEWNEEAFVHLDRTLAEAARQNLRVQLCLANWWRDTGGVVQYLAWAGQVSETHARASFGVDANEAMRFYTDAEARRLYREHVRRVVARRNTVTGKLYAEDSTIFAYELINEAGSVAGREAERRLWFDEMSRFVKSLDARHLVTPGAWGYRTARERREWLADHALPAIDFCDVHVYPRDDTDSFVDTPAALRHFIENRMAAALSLRKPLVFGEFGMVDEGYANLTREEWFRAYFESAARAGVGGAYFWIATNDENREYGVTLASPRDRGVRDEIRNAAELFDDPAHAHPPRRLYDAAAHLVPHTTRYALDEADAARTQTQPSIDADGTLRYSFAPEQLARAQFEKLGRGAGYVWGAGAGFFEFVVPARWSWRSVGEIVVRAHLQPVPEIGTPPAMHKSRVTLFVNDADCGSRVVELDRGSTPSMSEWRVTNFGTRTAAAFGRPLNLRFEVEADADLPHGLNISNFPEGYDARGSAPLEVEVR